MVGYLVIFGYIFFLIFVIGIVTKKLINGSFSRKIIHILLLFVWIFINHFFKNTIHQIIIPIIFLIVNVISYKFKLFKTIEREEDNHLGTIYFAIGISIMMAISYVYPQFFTYSGVSVICLCLGDGTASLLGYAFGKNKIYNNKTYLGFVSCIIATFIGLFIFKFFFFKELSVIVIFLIAIVTGIIELVDLGLDNFTTTLVPFTLLIITNGLNDLNAIIALGLATIIFFIIYFSKSITYYGSLLSMLVVFSFTYYGGYNAVIYLLICYFIVFIISFIKNKIIKNDKENKTRCLIQIAANGLIGMIFCILSYYFNKDLLIISMISIGGCFIDSISSDVGVLSKKQPYDIFKRKRVTKGLSGGVTVLGTVSSLIGSLFLGLLIILLVKTNFNNFIIYTLIIFFNTVIDTIFGSLIQVKYQCQKCNEITERKEHCNIVTNYYSGIKFIDNNFVNVLANICTVLLACITLFI